MLFLLFFVSLICWSATFCSCPLLRTSFCKLASNCAAPLCAASRRVARRQARTEIASRRAKGIARLGIEPTTCALSFKTPTCVALTEGRKNRYRFYPLQLYTYVCKEGICFKPCIVVFTMSTHISPKHSNPKGNHHRTAPGADRLVR